MSDKQILDALIAVIDRAVPPAECARAEAEAFAADCREEAEWREHSDRAAEVRAKRKHALEAAADLGGYIASLRNEVGQWTGKAAAGSPRPDLFRDMGITPPPFPTIMNHLTK